jgi:ABC-type transporter Mla subunit MlaD
MKKKSSYYKTGLFVIVGMLLLAVLIILLGARSLFEKRLRIETYFDESVQGLDLGSHVKFRGVSIGTVKEITFVQDEYPLSPSSPNFSQGRYILVKITIRDFFHLKQEEDFKNTFSRMIEGGLRVKVAAQGLTGTSYLELDYVDPKTPTLDISWKPNSYYVPSTKSTFSKIGASIDELVKKIDKADVEKMLTNIDKLVVVITKTIEEMQMSSISKDSTALLQEIRGTNRELKKILSDPHLQNFPQKLDEAVTNISKTTSKLNSVLTHNNYDINSTVENLRVASEDLKEITGNAKKYPSLIFFGDAPNRTSLTKQ